MQCGCDLIYIDGKAVGGKLCADHARMIANTATATERIERERCAEIVDNLAGFLGTPYTDPLPQFNTPAAIQEMHKAMAKTAADAIRNPVTN